MRTIGLGRRLSLTSLGFVWLNCYACNVTAPEAADATVNTIAALQEADIPYVWGDVNRDGVVNIDDALLVSRVSVGLSVPWFHADRADVNCDTVVNINDALAIAQYSAGAIPALPCSSPWPQDLAHAADQNAQHVYDYFQRRFGREGLDGNGSVASLAFSPEPPNNAQTSGNIVVIGDADGVTSRSWAYSLELIAHELTHVLIENTAGLRTDGEQGAVNESLADVFAVFAGLASTEGEPLSEPTWQLGEDVWTPNIAGDALRDLADPNLGYNRKTLEPCRFDASHPAVCAQPKHMRDYAPTVCGVEHLNLGIPNHAAYLLVAGGSEEGVEVAGLGARKAEQILYQTLTHHLSKYSNFTDLRQGAIAACQELIGQYEISVADCGSVNDAFAAVGIEAPVAAREGVSGRVTLRGAPAVVTVKLSASLQGSPRPPVELDTTTNANGDYYFDAATIAAALAAQGMVGTLLFDVSYADSDPSLNGRLSRWVTLPFFADGAALGGMTLPPFDIADIDVSSPPSDVRLTRPITFSWGTRAQEREYYVWTGGADPTDPACVALPSEIHSTTSYVVPVELPVGLCGGSFDNVRGWHLKIHSRAGHGVTKHRAILQQ